MKIRELAMGVASTPAVVAIRTYLGQDPNAIEVRHFMTIVPCAVSLPSCVPSGRAKGSEEFLGRLGGEKDLRAWDS